MLAGIKEILIISTPEDLPRFKTLLGNGEQLGLQFSYQEQLAPNGLAEAFILGAKFVGKSNVCLILGDNIFYGHGLTDLLQRTVKDIDQQGGASVFGYYVKDPQRYGIIELDQQQNVLSIEEKPSQPKSNYAVTGLYFYDNRVVEIAKKIKPSWRGELEITDVNNTYLNMKQLKVKLLGRGYAWLDTGTPESLLAASDFIGAIEERQGLKIACIEEIAYKFGYISPKNLQQLCQEYKNEYGQYLSSLLK